MLLLRRHHRVQLRCCRSWRHAALLGLFNLSRGGKDCLLLLLSRSRRFSSLELLLGSLELSSEHLRFGLKSLHLVLGLGHLRR